MNDKNFKKCVLKVFNYNTQQSPFEYIMKQNPFHLIPFRDKKLTFLDEKARFL